MLKDLIISSSDTIDLSGITTSSLEYKYDYHSQYDTITLTGTVKLEAGNTTVIGTNTIFYQELFENEFVDFVTESLQDRKIVSPTQVTLATPPTSNTSNVAMTTGGYSDVWNDRWLKAYATQKIKYQWGSNLSKFAGVQLPGGVTLDGPRIMEEARLELEKMEEEMFSLAVLPSDMMMG